MTAHLKISDHVVESKIGQNIVLHDRASGHYFALDAAGTMIWKLIKAGTAMEDIPALMARKFDADADRIDRDLKSLLAELFSKNILQGM